jgi:prevent-host-death family protein
MAVYSLAQAKDQLSRLVDEALTGEPVTITRHSKPVVTLTPTVPTLKPLDDEYLKQMRQRRALRPSLGADSVTLVREMRDEER